LIQRPVSYNSTLPTNFPTLYYSQTLNFQKQWTEGVDFEARYRTDLNSWSDLQGTLNLRLLWTHVSFLKTLGLPGSVITDIAGAANAPINALPADKAVLMADYSWRGLSLNVMERYYSSIRQNANPTLVYAASTGDLPAWFQTDASISYDFETAGMTAFVSVSNLLDAHPDILQVPGYTGSPGLNYPVVSYEDLVGRYFTLGVRFKM
jgi:hypothetical protein